MDPLTIASLGLSALQENQKAMQPDAVPTVKPARSGQYTQDAINRRLQQQEESPLGVLQLGLQALQAQPPEVQQQLGPKIEGAIQVLDPKYNVAKKGIV